MTKNDRFPAVKPRAAPGNALAFYALAVWLALACAYAWRIPPGDAPDERAHVHNVLYLQKDGVIPPFPWPRDPYGYETVQPPLYYHLCWMAIQPLRASGPWAMLEAMRAVSMLLHLGALWFLWAASKRLLGQAAWGPFILAAGTPMFAFAGAVVNNDAAADLAGALLIYLSLRSLDSRRLRNAVLIGAAAGAGVLCKMTVLPVAAVCLAALWKPGRAERASSLKRLGAGGAAFAAVSGWLFIRNVRLYGDLLAYKPLLAYDVDRYAWRDAGRWLVLFFESFWGRFGQMTRPMPGFLYVLLAILSALAGAGWIRSGRRLIGLPGRKFLAAVFAASLAAAAVHGFFLSYQPQARHVFPAMAAWAVLFWDGLSVWAPEDRRSRLAFSVGAAALLVAAQWAAWDRLRALL